ncbi:FAS1-like dehydratase domain-containing protein [Paenibacillus sacheonensis]|uniref:FAS1-like dehydratase domain-containing protein n=1 Tax=Paenibacillus sacheonensis TaxID=742054 RepID=A0A7X5C2H4_9BACL|nr:MaoC family dehydratase N-terminal domain-containing protein [Paenibacillus sacheonensis]MBM7566159.1 hypothetical protein [Paenibacillus sacheonensis]NBC70369.1 hypothetical protein [Paenibacillus sacheonensis]
MNRLVFRYRLTTASIMAYSQSIEAPLQKADEILIAPPTMPITFWKIADVPWLDQEITYIHGRQSFAYDAPLMAESHLDCELKLANLEHKAGSRGALTLYTHMLVCMCNGERIVAAETVLLSVGDPS